jgi:hypothetical protein
MSSAQPAASAAPVQATGTSRIESPAIKTAVASADPGAGAGPSSSAAASAAPAATASASASAAASALASSSAAPALTVQSAAVQEAQFSVFMASAKSYKVGETGQVQAVVVPQGDFHCNEKYPFKVKLNAAPAGVSFPSDVVRGASVSASRAAITVPFTATAAGSARISGKVYLSVCRADQCVMDVREVATTIKIE